MREKIPVLIGILLVVSGFAFLANPGMGDVARDDTQATPITWTAEWVDANMWNDPPLPNVAEPIIINVRDDGALFHLGDQDAPFSFPLDVTALTNADTDFTITGSGALSVSWIEVDGAPSAKTVTVGNPGPAIGLHTISGLVNISTGPTGVETYYPMTMTITYNPGVQQTVLIPLAIYVSSVGHDPATPDEKFSPQLTQDTNTKFWPYDNFEDSTLTLNNEATYTMFWENTVTANGVRINLNMPGAGAIVEDGGGIFMDPNDWAAASVHTLPYKVTVDPQTAPGRYDGDFTWGYYRVRPVSGERVPISETAVPFHLIVDFHVYVESTIAAPPVITQRDTHLLDFDALTFENLGNVELRDVEITIDPDGDDDVKYWEWQYEQGANDGTPGGRTFPEVPLTPRGSGADPIFFQTGDVDAFNLGIEILWDSNDDSGYGQHYLPLVVEGYFFDTGVTGNPTGWVNFELDYVVGANGLIPVRDPFVDLRAESTLLAGSTTWYAGNYDFGAWTEFYVDLEATWTAAMESDVIIIGGASQTDDIMLELGITCTESEAPWDNGDVSVWLQGGPGTPFAAGPTASVLDAANMGYTGDWKWLRPTEDPWANTDDYFALFEVDVNAAEAYEDDWHIPFEVTSVNVQDGATNTYRGWVDIWVHDITLPISDSGGAGLQIEEQTILIDRWFDVDNGLDDDLTDMYVELQIGQDTPFYDAEDHTRNTLTMYVGDTADGATGTANFDLDLNEDTPPGTWPCQLRIWGWLDDTGQYVELSDDSTLVIERLLPEPVDIYVSAMTYLDACQPGSRFTLQFEITNLGGQRAHDIVVDIDPSESWDDWYVLDEFLWVVHEYSDYVDTTNPEWGPDCQNAFDTSEWSFVSNVTFEQIPGEWRLPWDESLPLLGIESAADVYKLYDWTFKAYSSPVPELYTVHIDTIQPGEVVTIDMVFNADKEMIPGRVYAEEAWSAAPTINVAWEDEEGAAGHFATEFSLKTDATGTPYGVAGGETEGTGTAGDLSTGMMALVVVLLIIIIVLMLLGWSELRRPAGEYDDEYDEDYDDFEDEEEEPMPEPFEDPEAPEPEEKGEEF